MLVGLTHPRWSLLRSFRRTYRGNHAYSLLRDGSASAGLSPAFLGKRQNQYEYPQGYHLLCTKDLLIHTTHTRLDVSA